MDSVAAIILLLFGVLFGVISATAGIGGGAFYMSVMVFFFIIPINEARDTSTFIIALFSGVASISYFRQKKAEIKISLIFAGFSILGSIMASIIFPPSRPLDTTILKIIIASVVFVAGINMIRKGIKSLKEKKVNMSNDEFVETPFSFEDFEYKSNLKIGIPLFFLAGFLAYLSGIGGGMLFVPIFSIIFKIPIHFSTALSTTLIFLINLYNAAIRMIGGQIHYLIGILLGIGAIFGSLLGAKYAKKIPKSYLQFGVAAVLIGLAIRMYFV